MPTRLAVHGVRWSVSRGGMRVEVEPWLFSVLPLVALAGGVLLAEYHLPRLPDPTGTLPYVHPAWYWPAVLLLTITAWAAGVRAVGRLARRATPRDVCTACDYDLRATPERCPECGTARTPAVGRA